MFSQRMGREEEKRLLSVDFKVISCDFIEIREVSRGFESSGGRRRRKGPDELHGGPLPGGC